MVFLATFSGLTALTRLPIGRVRADPDTRGLYEAGLSEALAVAHARGIALPDDFVARTLARTDQLPPEMKASLLHDLEAGRRLELPWLSGAIVRMGEEQGVLTPTHAFVNAALKLHAGGG
jgi:2-dehydropantoate 2-reductase